MFSFEIDFDGMFYNFLAVRVSDSSWDYIVPCFIFVLSGTSQTLELLHLIHSDFQFTRSALLCRFSPKIFMLNIVKERSLTRFKLTIGFAISITISRGWCLKVHLRMVHVCHWCHCVVVALSELACFSPYYKEKWTMMSLGRNFLGIITAL